MSIRVMTAVFDHAPVAGTKLTVLLALADWASDEGVCWPSIPALAAKARTSERSAQRACRDMQAAGLLEIAEGEGRNGTNRFRIRADRFGDGKCESGGQPAPNGPEPGAGADTTSSGGGDNLTPHDDGGGGDTGDTPGVTNGAPGGDTGVALTVIEPSIEPSVERERAGGDAEGVPDVPPPDVVSPSDGRDGEAGGEHGARPKAERPSPPLRRSEPAGSAGAAASDTEQNAPPDPATVPGRAAFEKRVLRFCNGKGFAAGPWEDWDTGTPSYVGRQMAALSETERQQAERWRDPYLTDIRRRGKRPVSPGNFLRDRLWEGLDPELIRRFETGQTAKAGATPPDRAAPFGPVWAAMRLAAIAAGRVPADDGFRPTRFQEGLIAAGEATVEGLRVERHVRWLDGQAEQRRSVPAPGWARALKPAMEPVPVAGPLADDWRALFAERSWPWFPRADGMDVVFLPRLGCEPAKGPDGRSASPASPADLQAALAAFAEALETATDGATGDDREA